MATDLESLHDFHDLDKRVVALETHCQSCQTIMRRVESAVESLESAITNMKVKTAWNAGAVGALVGSGMVALVVGVLWEVFRVKPPVVMP